MAASSMAAATSFDFDLHSDVKQLLGDIVENDIHIYQAFMHTVVFRNLTGVREVCKAVTDRIEEMAAAGRVATTQCEAMWLLLDYLASEASFFVPDVICPALPGLVQRCMPWGVGGGGWGAAFCTRLVQSWQQRKLFEETDCAALATAAKRGQAGARSDKRARSDSPGAQPAGKRRSPSMPPAEPLQPDPPPPPAPGHISAMTAPLLEDDDATEEEDAYDPTAVHAPVPEKAQLLQQQIRQLQDEQRLRAVLEAEHRRQQEERNRQLAAGAAVERALVRKKEEMEARMTKQDKAMFENWKVAMKNNKATDARDHLQAELQANGFDVLLLMADIDIPLRNQVPASMVEEVREAVSPPPPPPPPGPPPPPPLESPGSPDFSGPPGLRPIPRVAEAEPPPGAPPAAPPVVRTAKVPERPAVKIPHQLAPKAMPMARPAGGPGPADWMRELPPGPQVAPPPGAGPPTQGDLTEEGAEGAEESEDGSLGVVNF